MKIFDPTTTAQALPYPALIAAIAQMFRSGCHVPRRHHHLLGVDGDANNSLLIMPAWLEGRYLGIKQVTIFPGNARQGLAGLHSTYTLFAAATGVPLAVVDGDTITVRRTAAASALAAAYLSRPDARRLLIVGSGHVAGALAPAYAAVRPIQSVRVWGRSAAAAEQLAVDLRGQGFDATATSDLEASVRWADIVSCATLAQSPLIQRRWLQPGVHLDLIGGFTPAMREADDDCFADTSVFVDTAEALDKAGDLLSPIAAGKFAPADLRATLEQLCRNTHPGRVRAEEITVYKCVGAASEDLAAAILVWESIGVGG